MDTFQKDFLTEIINIGLGRAGTVLGQISGSHVSLTVPDLVTCRAADLSTHLNMFGQGDIMTVSLGFSGIVSGDAMLVISPFSGRVLARQLFQDMMDEHLSDDDLGQAVTELGNIVINHFVGSWSEIFCDRFEFGVPEYQCRSLKDVVSEKADEGLYAVCAEAHLDIPEFFVVASLITLFDQPTLQRLVGSLVPANQV
jgi:chemotaxis protein CheC